MRRSEAAGGWNGLRDYPAVELGIVDLGRQDSIREFARGFLESHRELHVLVNNAAAS